jgi:hypothetical protein
MRSEEGTTTFELPLDDSDRAKALDIVNTVRARARPPLPPLTREQAEALIIEYVVRSPELHLPFRIDTVNYKRAVPKIAHELACYWLGPSYLDDPTAALLRRWVLDRVPDDRESQSDLAGRIELGETIPALTLWELEPRFPHYAAGLSRPPALPRLPYAFRRAAERGGRAPGRGS